MIDLHSHILPGIDTGAKTIDESVAMLKLCVENGITTVLATPHFRPDRMSVSEFIEKRDRAYNKLVGNLDVIKNYPNIIKGAEVLWTEDIADLEGLEKLCIERTRFILLELPCSCWSKEVYESLHRIIHERKIIPIISHIERYMTIMKNPNRILDLLDLGCYTQMNTHSLTDETTVRTAIKLIKHHMVQLLGSDFHNLMKRIPEFHEAFDVVLNDAGREYVEMFERNARCLLKNETLKVPVAVGINFSMAI